MGGLFKGHDVCFAPVRTLKEAFDDPATAERGMIALDAEGNEVVGTPLRFREEPARIDPRLPGEPAAADAVRWR